MNAKVARPRDVILKFAAKLDDQNNEDCTAD